MGRELLAAAVEIDNNAIMAAVVVALGALLGLYAKVRSWEKELRGESAKVEMKQPFTVTMAAEPLSRADHATVCQPLQHRVAVLENDVRAMRLKMDAMKDELLAAGEARAQEIHRRIDDLPARMLAMLKDTKGLL